MNDSEHEIEIDETHCYDCGAVIFAIDSRTDEVVFDDSCGCAARIADEAAE